MLCRFRSAALAVLMLCAGTQSLAAAQITVEKSRCSADSVRVEADHIAPHENPASAMSRFAMFACPSGFGIVQTQTLSGGRSIVWSVRCSVWDKPAAAMPASC